MRPLLLKRNDPPKTTLVHRQRRQGNSSVPAAYRNKRAGRGPDVSPLTTRPSSSKSALKSSMVAATASSRDAAAACLRPAPECQTTS